MRKAFYFSLIFCICLGNCCDLFTSSETTEEVQILYFNASPSTIAEGDSSELTWGTENATTVTIEPFFGEVPASSIGGVFPKETTTYTLTASNSLGSKSESRTVTVESGS